MENSCLLAGYARVCITPEESVPLAGYGNSSARMSRNVLSDLYTACIAFSDADGNTVLLFENDLNESKQQYITPIRQAISKAVGIPVEHIMVAATHTHSGPDLSNGDPSIERYLKFLRRQMVRCAKEALADRKPTVVSAAQSKTKGISYVRHYLLKDGSYKGVNLNLFSDSPIVCHSSEPDPHLQLLRFTRLGGKDLVLMNWQCHPQRTGFGRFDISSDLVGVAREEMAAALDCECIYFSGAGGNINPLSFDPDENHCEDYLAHGMALAQFALEAKDRFTPVNASQVRFLMLTVQEPFQKPDESLLSDACDVVKYRTRVNNHRGGAAYAEAKGFHSQFHASKLLEKHRLYQEGIRHVNVLMQVFSIGDVAFVSVPYEMSDTNGKYIRDFSPFKATIIATCANYTFSQVPSAYGFLCGSYETDCTYLTPGAGERLAQRYVELLKKLYVLQYGGQ